jgi:hypothetical protein
MIGLEHVFFARPGRKVPCVYFFLRAQLPSQE